MIADYAGGAVACALSQARVLMAHALKEKLQGRRSIDCESDAAEFLKALIGFRCDEALVVLFLDTRRCLIDYEVIAAGRPDSVQFDQRRILFRAVGRGASGIIVAHNHPSGDARPSLSDLQATRELADASRALGICLCDHLIVAGGEVRSALFAK